MAAGRIQAMRSVLFVFMAALFTVSCEQEQATQIEWQLPLERPQDAHGVQLEARLPDWAAGMAGEAALIWLDKMTTRRHVVMVASGGQVEIEGWEVTLLGLASGLRVDHGTFLNDENVHNPAAFVEIRRDGEIHYRGWLYERYPELFGMDNPDWKVWLKGITFRAPSETEGTISSLSSAG